MTGPEEIPSEDSDELSRRRRRQGRADSSWAATLSVRLERAPVEAITAALSVTLVVGSLVAIGGVHPLTLVLLSVASSTLAFFAFAWRTARRRSPMTGPAFVFWGFATVSLVQVIPLPIALTRALSPTGADVWERALSPFGIVGSAYAPLSLDPGATWIEALRWYGYGAVFVGASALASRKGVKWANATVFGAACLAALITVIHGLAGLDRVYGLYEPSFRQAAWRVGPLLNPNNLAGYLNLGALAGLGLLLEKRPGLPRGLCALGVAVLVGVNVLTSSRGGVLALIVGLAVLSSALVFGGKRSAEAEPLDRRTRVMALATLAFGGSLAVLGSRSRTWSELFDENIDKLAMTRWVRPVMGDFPWTGVGRGAFESVFPAYQPSPGSVVYTHVENFPAQWIVEWGIPVGVCGLAAFGWLLRPNRLRVGRSPAAAGAYAGLLALLVQNLADLGLEIPALGFAFALLLGALEGSGAARKATEPAERLHAPSAVRRGAVAAMCGLLLIGGGATFGMRLLDGERRELRDEFRAEVAPRSPERRAKLRAHLRDAMLRHPAEPYFPLLGAALAFEERDEEPIAWLQRVLERSRANGRAHFLLAEVLTRVGATGQALMELRFAISADPSLVESAAELAKGLRVEPADLATMIPSGELAGKTWAALGARMSDPAVKKRFDERAVELDPKLIGPTFRLAIDVVEQRAKGSGCIDDEPACRDRVDAFARMLEQHAPQSSIAAQLRARWLAAIGKPDEGVALLASACESVNDRAPCLRTRVTIATAVKSQQPLAEAAQSLIASECVDGRRCAAASDWLGGLHAGRGEWATATKYFERAVEHDGRAEVLLKLANAAKRAGLLSKALKNYERALKRKGGGDAAIEAEMAALRRQVTNGIVH